MITYLSNFNTMYSGLIKELSEKHFNNHMSKVNVRYNQGVINIRLCNKTCYKYLFKDSIVNIKIKDRILLKVFINFFFIK